MLAETDAFEQLGHAAVDLPTGVAAGQLQRQGDVLGHGLRAEQVEVLEDHPDALAKTPQAGGIEGGNVFAVDQDAPAGRLFQAVDQAQQGALAGTGMADQAKHFTTFDTQVGALQGADLATIDGVRLVDVMEFDHGRNLVGLSRCRVGTKAGSLPGAA